MRNVELLMIENGFRISRRRRSQTKEEVSGRLNSFRAVGKADV